VTASIRLLKTRDPAEAGPCRLRPIAYVYITASLRSFDALKAIFLLALILMVSPVVGKHLKKGSRIRIPGLGILQVRKRAARMGRNPALATISVSMMFACAFGRLCVSAKEAAKTSLVGPLLKGTAQEAERALKLYATALGRLHADTASAASTPIMRRCNPFSARADRAALWEGVSIRMPNWWHTGSAALRPRASWSFCRSDSAIQWEDYREFPNFRSRPSCSVDR